MPQWNLTRRRSYVKTDICPLCRMSVEEVKEHLKSRHRDNVVQMSDIFWINGAKEAFWAGHHYRSVVQ